MKKDLNIFEVIATAWITLLLVGFMFDLLDVGTGPAIKFISFNIITWFSIFTIYYGLKPYN